MNATMTTRFGFGEPDNEDNDYSGNREGVAVFLASAVLCSTWPNARPQQLGGQGARFEVNYIAGVFQPGEMQSFGTAHLCLPQM
jgi:hypothetical protein